MEVEIPSEKDFEYLNQAAKDFVKSKLSDLIQKMVDELDPDIDYIFDRIEIDLGKINFQNPQNLIHTFGEQFKK